MENNSALIESKPNLWTQFKKNFLGHNATYVDFQGKVGTLRYPQTKPYSDRLCSDIRELTITNVETIDDKSNPHDDLRHFKYLSKLTLGQGVKGISRNAIPTSVEELTISSDFTSLPEGFVSQGMLHKVSGPDFTINTQIASNNTTIHIDEFGRLNFTRLNHVSLGQSDYIASHRQDIGKQTEIARNNSAESLLHHSSQFPNSKTIYVYGKSITSDRDYSVQAVVDTFPMPKEHKSAMPDENLIGIFINGVTSLDTSDLSKYPNLTTVFLGKDIEKITGITDSLDDKKDNRGHSKLEEKTVSGKKQSLIFLSTKTLPIKDLSSVQPTSSKEHYIQIESDLEL